MPKPFDPKLALEGHPLVSRDGRKVLRLEYDDSGESEYPFAAILGDSAEGWITVTRDGKYYGGPVTDSRDLFLDDLPEVEETLWVNLYEDGRTHSYRDKAVAESNARSTAQIRPPVEVAVPFTRTRSGTWKGKPQ